MKSPLLTSASLLFVLSLTAADQPEPPRRQDGQPQPNFPRRQEGQPQANQLSVIPLPHGLAPGNYMLVPLPQAENPMPNRRENVEPGRVQQRAAVAGQNSRGIAGLTPDEQAKVRGVMEKVNQDNAVKEAREAAMKAQKALEEARLNERKVTEEAAVKADPSLAPIFEKLHQVQQPVNRQNNPNGNQPRAPRGE